MIEELPTYKESMDAIGVDGGTALQRFMCEYEPGRYKPVSKECEKLFRLMLSAVVVETQKETLAWVVGRTNDGGN